MSALIAAKYFTINIRAKWDKDKVGLSQIIFLPFNL